MSIKDQQAGGPGNAGHGQQGRRPAPRPRAATGLAAGSAMFSRMPAYTPVTRAPEQAYPQDPGYESQPTPAGYTYDETAQGRAYQGEQYAHDQGYADPNAYSGQEAQGYEGQAYEGQAYQDQGYQDQGYAGHEGYDPAQQAYQDEAAYRPEAYPQQGYDQQGYAEQPYQGQDYQGAEYAQPQRQTYQDSGYEEAAEDEPLDLGMEEASEYAEQPPVEQSFEAYGNEAAYAGQDAQGYDAYAPAEGYEAEHDAYSNGQAYGDQGYREQGYGPEAYPGQPYAEGQSPQGEYGVQDPEHAVQAYEAAYDGAPEIPLTYSQPEAGYENAEPQGDADFMGTEAGGNDGKVKAGIFGKYMGRRSGVMIASAVLGAVALGGALAFAFKQSGGGISGEPPLITAENTPVKEAPEQPGGKEFPHKNKLIYDRLENGDQPEADRLVPRQEELALPNMPAQTDMPNMPELASNDAGNTGAADAGDPDSGPRKVKTLTVRPDGSVDAGQATANAAGAQSEPTTTASIEPQAAPEPAPAPATNQNYVVQVASKKDQTSALAAFADMQQKYPSLLANYRPMVKRVNLGDKGVWYRLQVGPMNNQADASQLCGQLKSQGLNDCLVMAQ